MFVQIQMIVMGCVVIAIGSFSCFQFLDNPDVVVTVNGEPIIVAEMVSCMNYKHRAETLARYAASGATNMPDFWTRKIGDERPIDVIRRQALNDLVTIKVQQILLKKDGFLKDISYTSFLKKLASENDRRVKAVANHEIIYGPVVFGEAEYFDHILQDSIFTWKNTIGANRFALTEDQVRVRCESIKMQYRLPDAVKVKVAALLAANISFEKAAQLLKKFEQRLRLGEQIDTAAKKTSPKIAVFESTFDESTRKGDELGRPLELQTVSQLQPGEISPVIEENKRYMLLICTNRVKDRYPEINRLRELVIRQNIDEKYLELVAQTVHAAHLQVHARVLESVTIK